MLPLPAAVMVTDVLVFPPMLAKLLIVMFPAPPVVCSKTVAPVTELVRVRAPTVDNWNVPEALPALPRALSAPAPTFLRNTEPPVGPVWANIDGLEKINGDMLLVPMLPVPLGTSCKATFVVPVTTIELVVSVMFPVPAVCKVITAPVIFAPTVILELFPAVRLIV